MAVEMPAMNSTQTKNQTGKGAIGKSTLLSTTNIKIPMPSGAKEPAAPASNASSGSKSEVGKQ